MPIVPPVLFFDSELGGNHKSYFSSMRQYKLSRPKAIHHLNKCVSTVLFYILTFFFFSFNSKMEELILTLKI